MYLATSIAVSMSTPSVEAMSLTLGLICSLVRLFLRLALMYSRARASSSASTSAAWGAGAAAGTQGGGRRSAFRSITASTWGAVTAYFFMILFFPLISTLSRPAARRPSKWSNVVDILTPSLLDISEAVRGPSARSILSICSLGPLHRASINHLTLPWSSILTRSAIR